MTRRRMPILLLPLVLRGWWLGAYQPVPASSVSAVVVSDTVRAGRVFIAQLPDSIDGERVAVYSAERLPLASWLLDDSFMWATTEEDRGEHLLQFDALLANEESRVWPLDLVIE